MKKILFVDDEPKILQGLERMLHPKRNEWEMVFVTSGAEALEVLKKDSFNVIVSDMRMPQMDGATLLKKIQTHFPQVVRIVLSGYAEMETAMRAVPVAHQFLSKPCNASCLEEVVNRTCDLQNLLNDDVLQNLVGKIDHLPILPRVYQTLTQAMASPDISLKDVATIVEQDMALSAKILQLVNSAFFSLPHSITSVSSAVSLLGLNMLKNLSLSVEVFRAFKGKQVTSELYIEDLQLHAMKTANLAKKMFKDRQKSDDAFIAGMLHEIGKLILLAYQPDQFEHLISESKKQNKPWYFIEKEKHKITHAEIGAYLLGIWGLPYPVIESVADHHEPWRVSHKEFDILSAVYIADHLTHSTESELNLNYLKELNVLDQLPQWILYRDQLNEAEEARAHV